MFFSLNQYPSYHGSIDVWNMLGSHKGNYTLRHSNNGLESPDIEPK